MTVEMCYSLPKKLRILRSQRGLTQAEAASLVGTSRTTISSLESGRSRPRLTVLNKLAKGYNVPVTQLLEESDATAWHARDMQQTCKGCGRTDGIDFLVSNRVWNLVLLGNPYDGEGAGGVLCLECFDVRAEAAGVEYRDEIVVYGRYAWMAGTYEGGLPQPKVPLKDKANV